MVRSQRKHIVLFRSSRRQRTGGYDRTGGMYDRTGRGRGTIWLQDRIPRAEQQELLPRSRVAGVDGTMDESTGVRELRLYEINGRRTAASVGRSGGRDRRRYTSAGVPKTAAKNPTQSLRQAGVSSTISERKIGTGKNGKYAKNQANFQRTPHGVRPKNSRRSERVETDEKNCRCSTDHSVNIISVIPNLYIEKLLYSSRSIQLGCRKLGSTSHVHGRKKETSLPIV